MKQIIAGLVFVLMSQVALAAGTSYSVGCRFETGEDKTQAVTFREETVSVTSWLSGRDIRVTATQLGPEQGYQVDLLVEDISFVRSGVKPQVLLKKRLNFAQADQLGESVVEVKVKIDQGLYDTMLCGLFSEESGD